MDRRREGGWRKIVMCLCVVSPPETWWCFFAGAGLKTIQVSWLYIGTFRYASFRIIDTRAVGTAEVAAAAGLDIVVGRSCLP